jgi:hypothetical protein
MVALARQIVGTDASAKIQERARDVAEALIDLRRVCCARDRLLCEALNSLHHESRAGDGPQEFASILVQAIETDTPNPPHYFDVPDAPNTPLPTVSLPNNLTIPAGWTIHFKFTQTDNGTIAGFDGWVTDTRTPPSPDFCPTWCSI